MNGLREKEREENEDCPHNFILRSLDKPQKYFLKIPSTRLSLHSSNTPNSYSSHLSFNHDQNPYTPAFIQRSQEEAFSFTSFTVKSEKILTRKHLPFKPKVGEMKTRKSMVLPEPKSQFCSVCRENFQNYFSHINHPVHKKKAQESEGSSYIRDLVQVVKGKALKEEKLKLTKARINQSIGDQASHRCHDKSPQFQLLPGHI